MKMLQPIIIAGGTGSRLWPLSRELYPKQFLKLDSELTMLQSTVARLNDISDSTKPLIVCNEEHRFIAAEQLRQLNKLDKNIILEPFGRNTAPAIALAALYALSHGDDPLLLILSADHLIKDEIAFVSAINNAISLAEDNKLVTFGILAHYAETGYGYIQQGGAASDNGFFVKRFVEKPDFKTAEKYVSSGDYYWNSGMFLFKASRYIEELGKFSPKILMCCQDALSEINCDNDFIRINKDIFNSCPSDSIDYAVMEKTEDAVVVPMDAGWSDIGSWSSLWDISIKDDNFNVHKGDVLSYESSNNYVYAETGLVTTVGVNNTIVVQTKDAVLVADKDSVQDVKKIVEQLKILERNEYRIHREVYRPWGKYDAIDSGKRYQVKRITVNSGEKLSIQMHHHRAEHWIVVSGTANVYLGDKIQLLTENQSIYIPLGTIHALENPGKIPLELIEVQSGAYLGEDDIVRFDDRYGRS
ncbi:mannose-1-phosphate guanylyltransferase/mannose-6-phosphate isomerase [Jinshanibacter sp. LJY008]|uniref:mannose-1-phosphate guanylyltransferase n=1 Tax=Limnobaculum eriocheiris TaxID=2897391 RepID=A0A9X1SNB8_9GAMM|nr:mannose-1-phosphate guanylyltransferase/mannose-6-phosphate isomerase [Limnobaculum eriocheiris]MCD1124792.1 mannose-1-phosphate guanylyltransferase/mannose-6-phosphate isomerase [Limnobaculum eriocheiris]